MMSVERRFWERVDQGSGNACWLWTGAISTSGYGTFAFRHGDKRAAHRVAWFLAHGAFPGPGLHVCHRCDNRLCVRPTHLFLGTAADNVADMDAKGRRNSEARHRGESSPRAKLREPDIVEIRRLSDAGFSQVVIADRFSVHASAISRVLNGRRWRHVA